MKKLLFTILVAALVFTGCKAATKPEETTISTSESSSETKESTTEATSGSEETTKETTGSEAESETKNKGIIKGVIDDITMSTLTVKAEDGTIMEFNTEGAEVVSGDGLAIEDKVEVTYEGKKATKVVEFQ